MTGPSAGSDGRDGMSNWPTGRLLSTAARLVENDWHAALERQGLTHAGLVVLHLLEGGALSQGELAARARVQAQTMSRTIERLERVGYVARKTDPSDGRRRVVTLTESGAATWERTRTLESEIFPRTGDRDALRKLLLEIIRSSRS
ncbi:MAG TPA: MarR family transcriptional regulator [Galbitalea sp.]